LRATYFTVTWELLRELGVTNLETDNLPKLLQLPETFILHGLWQDHRDWQMNCFRVSIEGESLPACFEKKEGEMMRPAEVAVSRTPSGELTWLFRQAKESCPTCGRSYG
jgi:hypothetical protein